MPSEGLFCPRRGTPAFLLQPRRATGCSSETDEDEALLLWRAILKPSSTTRRHTEIPKRLWPGSGKWGWRLRFCIFNKLLGEGDVTVHLVCEQRGPPKTFSFCLKLAKLLLFFFPPPPCLVSKYFRGILTSISMDVTVCQKLLTEFFPRVPVSSRCCEKMD